ncbi:MAG: hypothetical protein K6F84_06985 [Lachnospiraceae bacterium]|nr:hypothetical protein [Lachnospiraceae bacterium]
MKKNLFKPILCMLTASLMMASCGKTNNDNLTFLLEETQTESSKESTEAVEASIDEESVSLYESFLKGETELICDTTKYQGTVFGEEGLSLNGTFTISEFLEKTLTYMSADADSFQVGSLQYAYVDCGNDTNPQLVLRMHDIQEYYNSSDLYVVINKEDDKLYLRYGVTSGYRSSITFNSLGGIVNAGSIGATDPFSEIGMLDKDCNYSTVYTHESMISPTNLYIPGNERDFFSETEELGITDTIQIEVYNFHKFDYTDSDINYSYTYYELDADMNPTHSTDIYTDASNVYYKFMHSLDVDVYTPDEIKDLLNKRLKEAGCTDDIKNAKEAEFTELSDYDNILSDYTVTDEEDEEITEIFIPNPGWDLYTAKECDDLISRRSAPFAVLEESEKTKNEITDEDNWFETNGFTRPSETEFEDDCFLYNIFTYDDVDPCHIIDLYDKDTRQFLTRLNFDNYMYPDEYDESVNYSIVEQGIDYVLTVDDIMYVSVSHGTYASSAPHNAYVIALDVNNNYNLLWKSSPLTSNSRNFCVVDDSLICGYGFTDEKDHIFVLDRFTGNKVETYDIDSKPEYFFVKDDTLYVRTYDTDYKFNIVTSFQ